MSNRLRKRRGRSRITVAQFRAGKLLTPSASPSPFRAQSNPVRQAEAQPQQHHPFSPQLSPSRQPSTPSSRFDAAITPPQQGAHGADASASLEQACYELLKHSREADCNAVRNLLVAQRQRGAPLQLSHADRDGGTALHRACASGHLAMAQLLVIEGGASIHQTNAAGDTPALVNAQSAHPNAALLRFLIGCGSDLHAKENAAKEQSPSVCLTFPRFSFLCMTAPSSLSLSLSSLPPLSPL